MSKIFLTLTASLLSPFASSWAKPVDDSSQCIRLVHNVQNTRDLELLQTCYDFFWANPDLDPLGGQFTSMILIGKRVVKLVPTAATYYTNTAWLDWSGYATWLRDPESVPDGEFRAEDAIELLESGMPYLGNNLAYLKDCADTIWPLASYHKKNLLPWVVDRYQKVFHLSPDQTIRIRVGLNLGHLYRKDISDKVIAIEWYKKVLEIDPDNAVAIKFIKQLEGSL